MPCLRAQAGQITVFLHGGLQTHNVRAICLAVDDMQGVGLTVWIWNVIVLFLFALCYEVGDFFADEH